ncbi:translocation/assembly module TamB domain-containing protein [soil metagenome]
METQSKNKAQVIAKAVLKITAGFLVCLILIFGLLLLALRIPAIQTRVVQKAAAFLSEKVGHQVTVQAVDIRFFSRVLLEGVQVLDYRQEELFSVGELDADISVFSLFQPNELTISSLTLENPRANLVQYAGTDTLNVTTFVRALNRLIKKKETTQPTAFQFDLEGLHLRNGSFVFHNQNTTQVQDGIDFSHLVVDSLYGDFRNFGFVGDTIQVTVEGLRAQETRSGIRIHELNTQMTYASTFWEWGDLLLRLNDSRVAEYVRFDFRRLGHFAYFMDSVQVTARLRDAVVQAQDVALFVPQIREYPGVVRVSADVTGTVSDFDATKVELRYGENTHIIGNVSANGLPDIKETFIELNLRPSTINARDLQAFIPAEAFPITARLGTVTFQGQFLGFPTDFVANGAFNTALGRVVSDINLKIEPNLHASSYRGFLRTENFNVGRLIGDESTIRTVSMTGRVEGAGFNLDHARLNLDATIQALYLNNYNYRNIVTKATLSRQTFAGDVRIKDPNLIFNASGQVDFRNGNRLFDISSRLERADLQALRISSKNLVLRADGRMNFSGSRLDDLLGQAHLVNASITYNGQEITADTISVVSRLDGRTRTLTLDSDMLRLEASGDFAYSTLLADVQTLAEEYRLKFESDEVAIANYYRRKSVRQVPDYEVDFRATLKDVNPVLHLFVPDLTISENALVEGSLRNGNTSIVSLFAQADTLVYNKALLFKNNFELTSSKLPFSNEVLASAFFTSGSQVLPGAGQTENFYVEGVWHGRTIDFSTNIAQTGTTNRANISGDLNFLQNQLEIVFSQSSITILGQEWHISPTNTILIAGAGKEVDFQSFQVSYKEQSISLAGALSPDAQTPLDIVFSNFQLRNLNPLLPQPIQGQLNAQLQLRDVYEQMILNSRLTVNAFHLDSLLIGDIHGSSDWDNLQRRLQVNLDIEREKKRVLTVSGFFFPREAEEQLSLLAVMDEAQIKMVEPFLRVLFHDLSGTASGRINISGRLASTILRGSADVKNGRLTFTYLNTTYTLNDRIHFTENSIAFRNLRLRDIYGNQATLEGGIFHEGFSNMRIDLRAGFTRFMVLNTTRALNNLYYGSATATGQVSVQGPPENLVVKVDARSEPGTFIYIPLDNTASIARLPFITFVNRNVVDTTAVQVAVENQRTDLSGINLTFNLDITEDAETSIIFDERAGDIIRGRGNGRIRMVIDTRGEFSMFGNYEIVRGAYNFTLANLINKEFSVREGGTITWNGDPFGGTMDLTATYRQITALPFLASDAGNTSRLRYPVIATMALKGSLISPEIKLGLEFEQIPPGEVGSQVSAFLNRISNDEQELNRQVFSLLAFRQLSPANEFIAGGAAAGGALSSLSDFVSSQFSSWISQVDRNLEVDIGLANTGQLNQLELEALQVRIGYSLLGGRLRVSREGGVSNANGSNAIGHNSAMSSVVGDWNVEYYLRPDGKLRLKMHYNTIPRRFDATNTASAGVSILHTERFDTFAELFARKRPRKREREEQEETERLILDSDERILLQR